MISGIVLSINLVEHLGRFLFLCIGEEIKKHRNDPYERAEDWPATYAKPIRNLVFPRKRDEEY
ncbi:MAG: hypothetical protein CO170_02565 [candidate division SR1 bacterium CG_4_9_14_3_um_filter_40_9]|nr:MAG: hypothetical protein CO170_02565 [candidate division SR1 bacterium CG_4_9_14_3_um_filter_40_9]